MAKRYITIRVVNSSGKPEYYARVNLYIYQFAASGSHEKYTNHDGVAEFDLDIDEGAEVSVSVNGNEKVRRGSIRTPYTVTI